MVDLCICSRCLIWITIKILTGLTFGRYHIYCPHKTHIALVYDSEKYESSLGNIIGISLKASQYYIIVRTSPLILGMLYKLFPKAWPCSDLFLPFVLGHRPDFVLPDRHKYVNMERHFLKSYLVLTIKTCHQRGCHATGGMSALLLPSKKGPEYNAGVEKACRSVRHCCVCV